MFTRGPEAGLHVKTNVYERGQAERQKCEEQAEMSRQADGCNTEAEPIWERVNGAWASVQASGLMGKVGTGVQSGQVREAAAGREGVAGSEMRGKL